MTTYKEDFYKKYAPLAQAEEARGGLPASVTLAQAYLESTSAQGGKLSGLASKFNAFFGIKTTSDWKGSTTYLASNEVINGVTKPVVSGFRTYSTVAESFADHTDFLKKNPTYTNHGVFATKDPAKVATALKAAGYATNPNYASDIMGEIKAYNLTSYDASTSTNGSSTVTGATFGNTPSGGINTPITVDPDAPFVAFNPNAPSLLDPSTWMPAIGTALQGFAINATTIIIIVILGLVGLFLIYKMLLPNGVSVASLAGVKI